MNAPLIGIDLVEPKRLQDRLDRTQGLDKEIFTSGEITYCLAQPLPYENLAARFCAKEAAAKALGLDGFEPLEIEVVEGGPTARLILHGDAKARAESLGVVVSVSLTHIQSTAAAVVLALPRRFTETPELSLGIPAE